LAHASGGATRRRRRSACGVGSAAHSARPTSQSRKGDIASLLQVARFKRGRNSDRGKAHSQQSGAQGRKLG